jgi:hypothetical protein
MYMWNRLNVCVEPFVKLIVENDFNILEYSKVFYLNFEIGNLIVWF